MTDHFVVVWGRSTNTPKSRPYSTYTAKDGRPLAFAPGNLWFADCPSAASLEELDAILSHDHQQEVVIMADDAAALFGWTDLAHPSEMA